MGLFVRECTQPFTSCPAAHFARYIPLPTRPNSPLRISVAFTIWHRFVAHRALERLLEVDVIAAPPARRVRMDGIGLGVESRRILLPLIRGISSLGARTAFATGTSIEVGA